MRFVCFTIFLALWLPACASKGGGGGGGLPMGDGKSKLPPRGAHGQGSLPFGSGAPFDPSFAGPVNPIIPGQFAGPAANGGPGASAIGPGAPNPQLAAPPDPSTGLNGIAPHRPAPSNDGGLIATATPEPTPAPREVAAGNPLADTAQDASHSSPAANAPSSTDRDTASRNQPTRPPFDPMDLNARPNTPQVPDITPLTRTQEQQLANDGAMLPQ